MGACSERGPGVGAGRRVTRRSLPTLLEAHCEALGACRACAYEDTSVVPVITESRAPIAMLIGQAPGKTEMLDRRPFAGRAGRTLFRWLERAGVIESKARELIYIAAMTRCYPGPSPTGRGDRVPSPREIELCSRWLDEELRLIAPRLIIPVGRLAIARFFGAAPLDRVVGLEHDVSHTGGRSIAIPLPHPSGASSWIHGGGHAELVDQAIALLRNRFAALRGVSRSTRHPRAKRRVA